MSNFAGRLWCGRRRAQEPHEEVVGVPEQERAQQEARMQVQQQRELFEAIERCDQEHIKRLRGQFSFKNVKDNHERTPLHVLADLKMDKKKVEDKVLKQIFMILKEEGCDVNSVDEYGNTPVKLAAEKGCIQVLKCLLEERADMKLPDKYKEDTPLHWAAKNGMYEATELLIQHQGLVEQKLQLNPQNKDKQTPLHLAVQKNHEKIVRLLLICGADSSLKDKNDFTPLDIATRSDRKNIMDLLTKPLKELIQCTAVQADPKGRGEIVECDSGRLPDCLPMTALFPAVNIKYNVHISGNAVAAVGPHPKVLNVRGQNDVPETPPLDSSSSLVQTMQLPSPSPSPSTGGSAAASYPAVVAPTAPLSPEQMDIPRPLPSAPPMEDDDASSG